MTEDLQHSFKGRKTIHIVTVVVEVHRGSFLEKKEAKNAE